MTEFKTMTVKEIFDVYGTKSLDAGKLKFVNNGINFVGRINTNNGVQGKIDRQSFPPNEANTITATVIGNYKYVKFQSKPYYCSQNINKLVLKKKFGITLNYQIALYFITLIKKFVEIYNGQQSGYKLQELKNFELILPVISKTNHIDFKYMENQIKALEHNRIEVLARYITVNRLDNYQLTEEERQIIADKPKFHNFKIIEIFDVINTHSILKSQIAQLKKGSTPYLTAAEGNNAVYSYVDCPSSWTDKGNCVFIGGKTMVVTYQEKDFCSNDSHNLALYLKNDQYRTPLIQQYFVGAIKKSLSKKYTWGDSISKTKIKKDIISLPVIPGTDNIDFDYIKKYIKAIQKLTIKDVVKYKDSVINKSKEIINGN